MGLPKGDRVHLVSAVCQSMRSTALSNSSIKLKTTVGSKAICRIKYNMKQNKDAKAKQFGEQRAKTALKCAAEVSHSAADPALQPLCCPHVCCVSTPFHCSSFCSCVAFVSTFLLPLYHIAISHKLYGSANHGGSPTNQFFWQRDQFGIVKSTRLHSSGKQYSVTCKGLKGKAL